MKRNLLKYASLNALGTALYISLVSSLLFYGSRIFGANTEDTVLAPMAMLLLFVLSASVTGFLVLGRPVLWYLDGNKKEAVSLLAATLGCLFVITFLVFLTIALLAR